MEDMLALEHRVWQRVAGVRSPEDDLQEALEALIHLGRNQAAGLKRHSRNLQQQEAENLALLTALYHLRFGKRLPKRKSPGPDRDNCRSRAEKMLRLYIRLENHRELGPLFTHLTRVQRATCAALGHAHKS